MTGPVACALVVLLASNCHAAVLAQLINRGTPTDGVTTAVGYTGWVIRLVSDDGNITAIDLEASGRGLFGAFVQRWPSIGEVYLPTPVGDSQNLTPEVGNFDSHVLPPDRSRSNIISAVPPMEDSFVGVIPPFPQDWKVAAFGRGTYIRGAFGIIGTAQSHTYELAYMVLPNDAPLVPLPVPGAVNSRAQVATAGGTFDVFLFSWIPEPATSTIAGAATVCFAATRRRRTP
jgi:hypothetical protein